MTIERLQRCVWVVLVTVLASCAAENTVPEQFVPGSVDAGESAESMTEPGTNCSGTVFSAPMRVKLPGSVVEIELLAVPGGTLQTPEGPVEVAPFWLARTETTWDAYDVMVFRLDLPESERQGGADGVARPTKPYINVDRGFGHAGYPALSMSALGAEAFCRWLSEGTGKRFRLPTPGEHAWAARALSETPYGCGSVEALAEHAWFRDNSGRKTHPVGEKGANAWGFVDLHGNVAEWTIDSGGRAAVVGGSFNDSAQALAAGSRREPTAAWNASDPQIPKSVWWLADASFVGFRIACDSAPGE
jgi:formylglycine-generating enzyme required for sulfatase activity